MPDIDTMVRSYDSAYALTTETLVGGDVKKKLTSHGNPWALVIDKSFLDLLNIGPDTTLSATTDGRCLIITPTRGPSRHKRLQDAIAEGHRRYGKALRKLSR